MAMSRTRKTVLIITSVVVGLVLVVFIGLALFAVSCQVSGAFDFRRVASLFRRRRT